MLIQLPLSAEFRTFTNDFGDTVDAQLVELKDADSIVRLKLRNGSEIDARITAFSEDDQKYMREWWVGVLAEKHRLKERSRLRISAKMNLKSSSSVYDSWYYVDDKIKSFFPEVVIRNDELTSFVGNTVRIVVIAEDKRYKDQRLIVSATTMKADFSERTETVLESDPFRLRLYEYDVSYTSNNYAFGYAYEGFVVVIRNSAGEITHTRASKSKYLTNMDVIENCKAGEMYDESIDRKLNAVASTYFVR